MNTALQSCTKDVSYVDATIGLGLAKDCVVNLTADNYIVRISLVVNGYYIAPFEDVAVTVTLPGSGFTTGGGWLTEPRLGTRSNFGFTVKYLKKNIQGNNIYIHRLTTDLSAILVGAPVGPRDYNWIIKGNAMLGLSQALLLAPLTGAASTFTGKCNITAVDRSTGIAYSVGGNYQFQVDVVDFGEPGSTPGLGPDTYAIRVWNSLGTYYQLGAPKAQLPIAGGNIQVRIR